jgi:hypothetical protein
MYGERGLTCESIGLTPRKLRIMCGGRSELKRNEEFEIIFTIQKKMN